MLSQESCISMAHLATSSYPRSIPPWTSHAETELTAFIHRITHYHNQLPLISGDIISAAVQKDAMTLSGRWIWSKRSGPSSAAEQRGCPCAVPVGLTSEPLYLKFVQSSSFKSKPVLLVLRAPSTTHTNTLKICSITWSSFSAKTGEPFT